MLRHIFRLIWNRKRANLLLITEIFFSFVVLFGVGCVLIRSAQNYSLPLGFDHDHVWRLNITAAQGQKMPRPELDAVLRQVKALPGVQSVALTSGNLPFTFSTMNGFFHAGKNNSTLSDHYDADDNYAQALRLNIREGRWFKPADDASKHRPLVISQMLRQELFGAGPALGKVVEWGKAEEAKRLRPGETNESFVVVGVADDVRTDNDFAAPTSAAWKRLIPYDTTHWENANVLVRVAPGQGGELQEKIARTVGGVTRQWSTEVRTIDADRQNKRKFILTPMIGLALVGGFLIVNVALGLFGVLWYNINQRRAEIGLRRALGATGPAVSWQFLGEMMVVTTLGVVLGVLLAAQFPLLGVLGLPASVYILAIAMAAGMVYFLTALCAWHPSRIAARIHPAVALREE